MKVKELIELLKNVDGEEEIRVKDKFGNEYDFTEEIYGKKYLCFIDIEKF